MTQGFIAGLVQMRSGRSVRENVEQASRLIREAAGRGASYVQTPEMTTLLTRSRDELAEAADPAATEEALARFRSLAGELGIWLHIGSMAVSLPGAERMANRAFVIGPDGTLRASYDKIHMFDVDLPNGESWRESRTYQPGESAALVDLPWGRLGLSICYDLRFATLFRALAERGADFLTVPAAFTRQTGEAHWHVLLRARAIETGTFVLAAAQGGTHEDGRQTYGHSLIVDPWGRIVAEAEGDNPCVVTVRIDPAQVQEARKRIPVLEHGRRFALPESGAMKDPAQ
jgi:predicted amidohydrolase